MPERKGDAGLKLMVAGTILLALLVIFIFLSSNNVSAQVFPTIPH